MGFSADEIAEMNEMYAELFDSFKEEIVIYRTPTTALISVGPSYNFSFGANQPSLESVNVIRSGSFWATVEYLDNIGAQQIVHPSRDTAVAVPKTFIRIGVTGDARDYITQIEKLVIDGSSFEPASDPYARGIINRSYYDYFFKKIV